MGIKDKVREKVIWASDILLLIAVIIYGLVKLAKDRDPFAIKVLIVSAIIVGVIITYVLWPQLVIYVLARIVDVVITAINYIIRAIGV